MSEYFDEPTWVCPKCGSVRLCVIAVALFTVDPDGSDFAGGDIEWDENARMSCDVTECDWTGTSGEAAKAAETYEPDPDEGDPCADPVDDEGWGGEDE
jgi:hypothetical protein